MRRETDDNRRHAVFFASQTRDFRSGNARRVGIEAARVQHTQRAGQGAARVADGDTDSPFADVETHDPHAIILSPFLTMTGRSLACLVAVTLTTSLVAQAQDGGSAESESRRVTDRIQALEAEADRLTGQARTLLGDLRKLEVERALQEERVRNAQSAIAAGRAAIQASEQRVATLEQQRASQLPDLRTQLVDMYKRGRAGYARLLFGSTGVREFGRTTRAVAALMAINQRRIADHQGTVDSLKQERARLDEDMSGLQAREADALEAQAAANRALASAAALIAQIDARRDLNAQLAGELQVAQERLQQRLGSAGGDRAVESVAVPIAPFRGSLEWPVDGRISSRFGRRTGPFGAATVLNGVEIAAPEGTAVRALHAGTVSYADAFTGFGNLVIVDHGGDIYSLYGYLASIGVPRGTVVDSRSEIGSVGTAPTGQAALYLEIRVDGRSVDPVQWLKPM